MTSFNKQWCERLIVALDVPQASQAEALVEQLAPLGVMFKVGMQLFYQAGMPWVQKLQAKGNRVFVDLKLHDIPNTVARATEALVGQGVTFLNVHTQGGPAMMAAAVQAAQETAAQQGYPAPVVLGVTLLTSLSQNDLETALKVHGTVSSYVLHLAQLAQQSGLSGVVCSAQEAALLRAHCGEDFLLVTPGIRPAESHLNDQSRILTPQAALAAGADYLVVGRPITQAADPFLAAQSILHAMAEALPDADPCLSC